MRNIFLGAVLAISALVLPQTSYAFSCPVDTATCNGNEYAVDIQSLGGTSWEATISILVLNTYTGNQFTDVVSEVQLKDFAASFSNVVLTDAPDGVSNWDTTNLELNANGCTGGATNSVCIFWIGSGFGVGFTAGDILTWTFTFDADSINDTSHLKYRYLDENGKKVGSLGSFDIASVPEPSTLALLGVGLFAIGIIGATRRRVNS